MYVFGILVLLGLGALATSMFIDRILSIAHELRAVTVVGAGIGLAWLADFNMWKLWGLPVRSGWVGVTLTGLAIGGVGFVWHEVQALFAGLSRKITDEAATLEQQHEIRRVA